VVEIDRARPGFRPSVNAKVTLRKQVYDSNTLRLKLFIKAALNVYWCGGEDFPKFGVEELVVVEIKIDIHEI